MRCSAPLRRGSSVALLAMLVLAIGAPSVGAQQASPASPQLTTRIVYLGRQYPEPPPLSLVDEVLTDEGIQGARLGLKHINATGRFLGHDYGLVEAILPASAVDLTSKAKTLFSEGNLLVIADLEPEDLLAVADLPEAKDAVILNIRTSDDALRQEQCRRNVFHVMPSWAMRADALAQYLLWKKWQRWLLVHGKNRSDLEYVAAIKRAARRFGGKIVEERAYAFEAGARRTETGHQQVQTQMPMLTQGAPQHDVVFVADASETFGEYLLFRTAEPRPVAGTHGLVAVAWHRTFHQWGGRALHGEFEKATGRVVTERDYTAWLAARALGEAVTRSGKNGAADVRAYMLSDKFTVGGFKGQGLTFRSWDQQLRQPILVSGPRALVSVSPQEGFLHPKFATDSLGIDEPETKCRLARAGN